MKALIVVPLQEEIRLIHQAFVRFGFKSMETFVGRLSAIHFPHLDVTLAQGGLGKVQFAVQTQYLLDTGFDWEVAVCAGAAGALVEDLSIGDIVVSTETVEHDIKNHFGKPLLPKFASSPTIINDLKRIRLPLGSPIIHFGIIASGDEDVMDNRRRKELHQRTRGLAVAWEGAGGARACQFSEIPFVEIRGITDIPGKNAALDFKRNLEISMNNIASLFISWLDSE